MSKKRIKRGKLNSVSLLRKSLQTRREELFNLSLKYADILSAKEAAVGFINEIYGMDGRIYWSWGERWCESLDHYRTTSPIKRAIVILAFFSSGTTYLIQKIVDQWNGMDPFLDELEDEKGEEAQDVEKN